MSASSSSRGSYLMTFGALLLLLGVTVAVAHLHLGMWSPVAAMGIATVKVVLIGLVFMHLQHETPLVRVFSVAGLVWLAILLVIVFSDYLTRTAVTPASVAGRL
jgi:cytochrome c oxidase subunit IV